MLEIIKNALWTLPCGVLIIITGFAILVKTRFYILRHPFKVFSGTLCKTFKNKKSFALMCTSLGGTIGVGNAIGVAGAIAEGGAGSVFWMGVAGIFSMAIKYAEIYLAILFKRESSKGPLSYIRKATDTTFFPILYSFLCIAVSLGMGNMSQMNAALNSAKDIIPLSPALLSVILTAVFILISVGGLKKISNFSKFAVPILSITYIFFLTLILIKEKDKLPQILSEVISGSGLFMGIKWHLIKLGVSGGFSKSVFSTEAGLGSAAFTHAEAENSPHEQALWGVVEVFIDTLICILTAFAILAFDNLSSLSVAFITRGVFEISFGKFGALFYAVSILTFAFTSILCWYYVGSTALRCITKNKKISILYFISFSAFMIISAFISDSVIMDISDISNAFMMLVNIPAVLILTKHLKFN